MCSIDVKLNSFKILIYISFFIDKNTIFQQGFFRLMQILSLRKKIIHGRNESLETPEFRKVPNFHQFLGKFLGEDGYSISNGKIPQKYYGTIIF